jgi:heterodisulfide reductase subunit C/nitrate reductase gamma subunit
MFFSISLYTALILCGIGLIYKVLSWFRYPINNQAQRITTAGRVSAAAKGVISSLFSIKIFSLIKILILDVLLLARLRRESFLRWLIHLCIFGGFILLLLMHALDQYVTKKLFSEYASTLNPFLFLRNLFGAIVLLGLVSALWRRISDRVMRLTTRRGDIYALLLLLLIILSGFLLEAVKIVSHQRYEEMVSEYSSISDEEEAKALKAYWAKEFAVVFPQTPSLNSGTLKKGQEVHILNCASCHSKPTAAFVSYGLARAISPTALVLGQKGVRESLRYFHFLVCFLGLAFLPFTKFFHILTSPLVLLINGVTDRTKASPANIATMQAIELDACTHCAACSLHCSVGPIYRDISNINIWPSEKLAAVNSLATVKEKKISSLSAIEEGAYICTQCYRCTQVCPVGIDLQDMWFNLRENLDHLGCPELFTRTRNAFTAKFDSESEKAVFPITPSRKNFKKGIGLSLQGSTFFSCFTCTTCSSACPVVFNYEKPMEQLGLLPHQIMYSLRLGLQDNVLGAGMIWDCLGCYHCQESCPQGVRVTDILFELKNFAFQQARQEEGQSKVTAS